MPISPPPSLSDVHQAPRNSLTPSISHLIPMTRQFHSITQILPTNLQTCSNLHHLSSVQAVMLKTNALQRCFLMNQFVSLCSSLNAMDRALSLFSHMLSPNTFVYNALIRGFVQSSCSPRTSMELYFQMLRGNLRPTSYTFSSLVKACGVLHAFCFGQGVHCQIWKSGFHGHVFVQTALVEFYAKLGRVGDARKVFDEMPERDLFACNTMVLVYARSGDMGSAEGLFGGMSERNVTAWNGMIDGYARLGDVDSAAMVFDQMPVRDLISWTMMITCYCRSKRFKEALAVFHDMMGDGVCPDEVTLATVISCCAHLGALDLGRQIHFHVMERGYDLDVYIGSALIDMYAKCGSLDRSLLVFYKLKAKNLFCWNSMIEGLSVHGYAKEALTMFNEMLVDKIKPNGVTFISILSACAHAGLVSEGREYFQVMTRDFSVSPQVEHYGCMVDLFCRAGFLEDALEVIKSMRFEPNSVVWGALLSGCRRSKNLEIAEIAVSKLIELEPNNCGYYYLLINMYAEKNWWSEVKRIRAKMKELGMEKDTPGCSWIEFESEVHQFAASDTSHPDSTRTYRLLDELDGLVKGLDQVLEYESVLLEEFHK